MDALILSRIQFAITVGFHFLFPPISIGLAWVLVVLEWQAWKQDRPETHQLARFLAGVFALTFVMGVASGIVMEFQFGTNWSEYSKFVGDIFGAPLAAEAIFAFFLESSFLGLYLFGRERVGKGLHWFSCLMVAFGATLSAFWILVAGSWMQTPAGYTVQNGRAELTSFAEAVFNPSMWYRFFHTMDACFVASAFFVAGIAAYWVLKNNQNRTAQRLLAGSLVLGLITSLMALGPTGHEHARQVAQTQPEKFAAMEGLYETQTKAPLTLFGMVDHDQRKVIGKIEAPGVLSWLAFEDVNAEVLGMNDIPEEDLPPVALTFASFHLMVFLGSLFILLTAWGVVEWVRGKLFNNRLLLKLLLFSIPLPLIAIESGWITAEVGRQPWIVYKLLRTQVAYSPTVPAEQVLLSLIMFSLVYALLLALYLFLLVRKVRRGPEFLGLTEEK